MRLSYLYPWRNTVVIKKQPQGGIMGSNDHDSRSLYVIHLECDILKWSNRCRIMFSEQMAYERKQGERNTRVDEADTVEKLLLLTFTLMNTIVCKLTKFEIVSEMIVRLSGRNGNDLWFCDVTVDEQRKRAQGLKASVEEYCCNFNFGKFSVFTRFLCVENGRGAQTCGI